jgi:DNA-binding phage protein
MTTALIVLLVLAVIIILGLLGRPSAPRAGRESLPSLVQPDAVVKEVVKEVIVYREAEPVPPPPRWTGPPLWQKNASFTEFTQALGQVVKEVVGGGDREIFANDAGFSRATLDGLIEGSNPQLQTVWKLCNSRQMLVSELLARAENRLRAEGGDDGVD